MSVIKIILTFDSGPHGVAGPSNTARILDVMKTAAPGGGTVPAVFFVHTHAPERMTTSWVKALVQGAHNEGHLIAVNNGCPIDHCCHGFRAGLAPGSPGFPTMLDYDLEGAKQGVQSVFGVVPQFVRTTYGITSKKAQECYTRQALSHIYWDVDSGDLPERPRTPEALIEKNVPLRLKQDSLYEDNETVGIRLQSQGLEPVPNFG